MAELARPGDRKLDQYRDYLLHLARVQFDSRLKAELDPSDIVQETLLKAHKARAKFEGQTERELAGWLRTILANTLTDAVRRFSRKMGDMEHRPDWAVDESSARLEARFSTEAFSPSRHAADNEQLARLARSLAQLPAEQRTALELKHLQGCSVAVISERMERSKASVVGLLYRGLKKLRELLEESATEQEA
jgi:RNA polymerase sigma-70 factor (ECF subfamily)